MADNIESEQHDLLPLGKSEISTARRGLHQRGLELIGNLTKQNRIIYFPKDHSIGNLYFHGKEKWFGSDENSVPPSQKLDARGEVSIPSEVTYISLHIYDEHPSRLLPLSQLNLGDLDGILISNGEVDDGELKHVGRLTKLQDLDLSFCHKITDYGFLHLQNLTSLRSLGILGTPIGDRGIGHLARLCSLEHLRLDMTRVSNFGLDTLKSFSSLRSCTIGRSDTVNDAGLISLGQLTKLENLALYHIKMSDVGLSHLRKMDSLRSLEIGYTEASDDGLEYLVELNNLSTLKLFGTSFTEAGLTRIKNALPNCSIYLSRE